jgi:hypothetical protein
MKYHRLISLVFLTTLTLGIAYTWQNFEFVIKPSYSTTYVKTYLMLSSRNLSLSAYEWNEKRTFQADSLENKITYFEKKYPKADSLILDVDTSEIYRIPKYDFYRFSYFYNSKASPSQEENAYKYFAGYRVSIYNTQKDTTLFRVQDNQLMMIQEAQDTEGIWRPIEHWAYSWCGNSYFENALEPKAYFSNVIVYYKGDFETLLRVKWVFDNHINHSRKIVYSQPFRGSIHYSQFNLPADFLARDSLRIARAFFRYKKS